MPEATATGTVRRPEGARLPARALAEGIDLRVLSMVVIFTLLCLVFNVTSGGIFFSPRNLSLLLRQAAIVSVVSAGVSILMVAGEIDLSIGSAVYLCSVVAAQLQVALGMGILPTILLTVGAGLVMGAWQGLWVVRVAVPSFVVTLAGLLAFRGLGYYVTDAATIAPVSQGFSNLSEGFIPPVPSVIGLAIVFVAVAGFMIWRKLARATEDGGRTSPAALPLSLAGLTAAFAVLGWTFAGFRGIPTAVLWVAGCGLVLWLVMTRTTFGRNAYMIGSNREASVLAGITVGREVFLGFVLMGALYGIAGTLITARLGASTPSTGFYMELDAIAAAVIGGTSLRGGVGTVPGAIVGAVLLTTIDNGMSILNVSSFVQLIIKGMVLLAALAFDVFMMKRRRYAR